MTVSIYISSLSITPEYFSSTVAHTSTVPVLQYVQYNSGSSLVPSVDITIGNVVLRSLLPCTI